MDKLNAMAAFVQIVDCGSLTAAAEVLGTSLPTMVRTLAALEAQLGVRLLNRTTRRITLTDEGRHYLERCRRILADVEEAESELVEQQSEPAGRLCITAPVMFGKLHVAPLVTRFMKRFGRVHVELLLLDRVVNLVDEGVDVAIRLGHLGDSSMIARSVGQIRQVLCASPGFIEAGVGVQRPEDLGDMPCVRASSIAPGPSWHFVANGKSLTVPVRDVLVCNEVEAAIQACAAGLGYGVFLSYQVEALVNRGKLVPLLVDYAPPPLPVHVLYSHARLTSTRVRVFVDWITRDLRKALRATA
jgi:DNA-binding transcriptional LysR family regulator